MKILILLALASLSIACGGQVEPQESPESVIIYRVDCAWTWGDTSYEFSRTVDSDYQTFMYASVTHRGVSAEATAENAWVVYVDGYVFGWDARDGLFVDGFYVAQCAERIYR